MTCLFLNIYSNYPEAGDDEMFGTTDECQWPKCSPASLRDQATILIRRTLSWQQRSSLPLPEHIQSLLEHFHRVFQPLRHFHFHKP